MTAAPGPEARGVVAWSDTSLRDLKRNWVAVAGLAIGAVGLTTALVAVTAHWLVPAMPWAAAIALGAIVAPPDAAAARAIVRQLNLPHRVVTILEGESLLNDASALLTYRLAVGVYDAETKDRLVFQGDAPSVTPETMVLQEVTVP